MVQIYAALITVYTMKYENDFVQVILFIAMASIDLP